MKIFRWLLAAPAGIAAWFAVFAAGVATWGFVERRLCPAMMVSGTCGDPRVHRILAIIELFFIALSAVAVVAVTAAVAPPSHRRLVASVTFCCGALVAFYLAIEGGLYAAGVAAIGSGLITAVLITRSARRSPPPVDESTPAPPS